MSLNKFRSDTPINSYLRIGPDTINCNILNASIIRVDNLTIKPIELKYCTRGGQLTLPIVAGPTEFLSLIPSFGTTTFPNGLKTGQQITIRTFGQIDSASPSNIITYSLFDGGNMFNSDTLSSIYWAPFDSVVFETRLTVVDPANVLILSSYSKNDGGQMINWLTSSVIQTITPFQLQFALQSVTACNFRHMYTEILATA
jgi:hypothetical protein